MLAPVSQAGQYSPVLAAAGPEPKGTAAITPTSVAGAMSSA